MIDFSANKLRNVRKKAGLSISELARKADLSKATIQRYETGNSDPSLEKIQQIANALEIPWGYFFGIENSKIDNRKLEVISNLFNEVDFDLVYNEVDDNFLIYSISDLESHTREYNDYYTFNLKDIIKNDKIEQYSISSEEFAEIRDNLLKFVKFQLHLLRE